MKYRLAAVSALSSVLLLSACATAPTGPSVMAFPGSGKTFEQFRQDDVECRQFADYQIGGNTSANDHAVRNAAVGTAIGAVAGAAILGGHQGTGVGAGAGLLFGSVSGANAAQRSADRSQRSYDQAYLQCMYAKGEQVPMSGRMMSSSPLYRAVEPAGQTYYPPPPPPGQDVYPAP